MGFAYDYMNCYRSMTIVDLRTGAIVSAFIGARRRGKGQDEYLSRPRFLAISEFGPRSIIYHEGSRYIVNRVILPVGDGDSAVTTSARMCIDCGYMHAR